MFGTLKVQSFFLTEVSDCGLLTSSCPGSSADWDLKPKSCCYRPVASTSQYRPTLDCNSPHPASSLKHANTRFEFGWQRSGIFSSRAACDHGSPHALSALSLICARRHFFDSQRAASRSTEFSTFQGLPCRSRWHHFWPTLSCTLRHRRIPLLRRRHGILTGCRLLSLTISCHRDSRHISLVRFGLKILSSARGTHPTSVCSHLNITRASICRLILNDLWFFLTRHIIY